MPKVMKVGVSLVTNQFRESGKCYAIVTDLRSMRIKYVGEDMNIHSTDDKKSFKILHDKYIPIYQSMIDNNEYLR
jgi:hypothetical protein